MTRVAFSILALTLLVSVAQAQRHGARHMGGGLAFTGICSSAVTIGNGLTTIEVIVKPTPEQQPALNELKAVAKLNADAMRDVCSSGYTGTLPERVTASEKRLDAALAGIRRLKPAVEKFYALLNDAKTEASSLLILP